jgi:hypothetical protein
MSTDQQSGEKQAPDGVLSKNVVESISVREQSDSYVVTFPKDCAHDLGISKGDNVVFLGERGDDVLEVGRSDRVLGE